MDFQLSAEQKQIQDATREVAAKEIAPHDGWMDRENQIDTGILQKMSEQGYWGVIGDKGFEGMGLGAMCGAICMEEIAKASGSIAITLDAHWLCLEGIQVFGTDAQKAKYLADLCSGQSIGAVSWTEPSAGSDAAAIKTTAHKKGDTYILNGTKCFVTNGGLAGVYLIGAVTDPDAGSKGISFFIVEDGTRGLTIGPQEDKMGLRGSHTTELILENVEIPKENLLGKEGDAFKQAMLIFNSGRIWVGAISVGTASAAMEASVKYAKERETFGKPLAKHQGIQFKLADMDTEIQAARWMVCHAAWLKDQGKPHHKEAAQCKYFSAEVAMRVCKEAIQIYGGYGYIKDYDVERYFRNAKLNEIGEGTSEILRMLVAKDLLG